MKAYKVELLIIDHDELGAEDIKDELEHTNYANDCIMPTVQAIQCVDIGEWTDDHPLNQCDISADWFSIHQSLAAKGDSNEQSNVESDSKNEYKKNMNTTEEIDAKTLAEAADVTGATVRRWIAVGLVPARRIAPGSPWRIPRAAAEEILERIGRELPKGTR